MDKLLKKFKPSWIYVGSKDADLRNYNETQALFEKYKPKLVIHLAARVCGLFGNLNYPTQMYEDNSLININVLRCAYEHNTSQVISALSTCIFPDGIKTPITESDIHKGPPHPSNEGYAYSKRMLECQTRQYNKQYNTNYKCVIPVNLYGPGDTYDEKNSHVIPSIIQKIQKKPDSDLHLMGTGNPLRQFMFSEDFAKIIIRLIDVDFFDNVIICPPLNQEYSIKEIAETIGNVMKFQHNIIFENNAANDGQYRKTASPKRLFELIGDFQFTPLDEALNITYKDYIINIINEENSNLLFNERLC